MKLNNLSPEQIQKLKDLGFLIQEVETYICTCPFCGKEFKRKTHKQAKRSIENHFGKCRMYKYVKAVKKCMPNSEEFKMGDITYLLTGEFPENYKPSPENIKVLKFLRKHIEEKDENDKNEEDRSHNKSGC